MKIVKKFIEYYAHYRSRKIVLRKAITKLSWICSTYRYMRKIQFAACKSNQCYKILNQETNRYWTLRNFFNRQRGIQAWFVINCDFSFVIIYSQRKCLYVVLILAVIALVLLFQSNQRPFNFRIHFPISFAPRGIRVSKQSTLQVVSFIETCFRTRI